MQVDAAWLILALAIGVIVGIALMYVADEDDLDSVYDSIEVKGVPIDGGNIQQ